MREVESFPLTLPRKSPIIRILDSLRVGEDIMRVQDPSILTTEGEQPRYYIKPYIDTWDENGNMIREQKRIYLGRVDEMGKREAIKKKNEIMQKLNKSGFVLSSQIVFGDFLDTYIREYVSTLRSSSQRVYTIVAEKWLRPSFSTLTLGQVTTQEIDGLMRRMEKDKKSYAYRKMVKNFIGTMYKQAEKWGLWKERSPTRFVNVGRNKRVWVDRKWTVEETIKFLSALPYDVRLICELGMYCTMRIGEVMGVEWKHIDWEEGCITIEQQLDCDGVINECKTESSERKVAIGELREELYSLYQESKQYTSADDRSRFVCVVEERRKKGRFTRDIEYIRRSYLKPVARKLGLYVTGFGFHHFRREAITEMVGTLGSLHMQRMAGHTQESMTLKYTKRDIEKQDLAVREFQERMRGKVVDIRKGA